MQNTMTGEFVLGIISIIATLFCVILGAILHRQTEHVKIIENQLSDKKYNAYANLVELFFIVLKDIKKEKTGMRGNLMDKMLESKQHIFMYGSDNVIHAFNRWLSSTTMGETQYYQLNAFLDLMIEIRKDMKGKSSKISKRDLLINLIQNENEVDDIWKELCQIK